MSAQNTTPYEASTSSSYLIVSSLPKATGVASNAAADPVAVSPAACGVSLPAMTGSEVFVGSASAAAAGSSTATGSCDVFSMEVDGAAVGSSAAASGCCEVDRLEMFAGSVVGSSIGAAVDSSAGSSTGTSEGIGAGTVVELSSLAPCTSAFFSSTFFGGPFVFGFAGAAAFCLGGLLASVFSCVLLALAAVGFIILSRKLPSAGATLRRKCEVCDVREDGRCSGASEDRLDFVAEVDGFGFEVVDARRLLLAGFDCISGSCFAREDAVGAVRCEGRLTGFVVSLGLGLEVAVLDALSLGPDRAIDAAVGAVRELRLAFLRGALAGCAFGDSVFAGFEAKLAEVGVLALAGDLIVVAAGFGGALVEIAAGLPVPLTVGFFPAAFAASALWPVDFLKSSATGGNACPPLTASALAGSAGLISFGSSSAPVTGLSGFSASFSTAGPPAGLISGVAATLLTAVSGPAGSWLILLANSK